MQNVFLAQGGFEGFMNPGWSQIAIMALALLSLAVISWRLSLRLEQAIVIGMARTALQLGFLGLILKSVFATNQWYAVLGMVLVMGIVASVTVVSRQTIRIPRLVWFVGAGVLFGAGGVIFWFTQVALGIEPWFEPHYLIPLSGMMIGNSMNSMALAFDRLAGELGNRRATIETALALGADVPQAAAPALRAAHRAALLPTMMELSTVGLVQIPGMMSGQILGGVDPTIAVKYQILIMFAWAASAGFAVLIATRLALRHYFTPDLALLGVVVKE